MFPLLRLRCITKHGLYVSTNSKKERKSTTLLKVCKPLSAEIFPRKNRKNLGSPLGFSQKRNVKRVGDESNFGISTRLYMNYEEEDS